jgi:hypothetical protein
MAGHMLGSLRLVVSVDMTLAPRTWRPKRPCLNTFARQEMLIAPGPRPHGEDIPIYNGPRCTLLELSEGKFRWPLSNLRAAGFCLRGNEPVKGLPYCMGMRGSPVGPAGIAAARLHER